MSFRSSHRLMTALILDTEASEDTRLEALRDSSYRPTQTALLKLIESAETPPRLRRQAIMLYSQMKYVAELKRNKALRKASQEAGQS